MSKLSENRIDFIFTQENIDKIEGLLQQVTELLPESALTDEERSKLLSMDVSNRVFVEEVINEMDDSSLSILPPFLKSDYLRRDLQLFMQSNSIESKVLKVLRRVSDIKRLSSHESYGNSLAVYRVYGMANDGGIVDAKEPYMRMKKRFEAQSNKEELPGSDL